jgi:hypothetical protein
MYAISINNRLQRGHNMRVLLYSTLGHAEIVAKAMAKGRIYKIVKY